MDTRNTRAGRSSTTQTAHGRGGRRRPATLKKRIKTVIALTFLTVLSALAFGLVYFIFVFVQVDRSLPPMSGIGDFQPYEGTKIYYSDGPLMAVLATENRRPVALKDISKHVADATIAAEDKRFYTHQGVDMYGVARAIFRNVSSGDLKGQGGSTITQQLARNVTEFGLTKEKRLRRKVAEAILAMRLEQTFTKDEILTLYLNQIYYGNGASGIEAAARAYFRKSAKNLSIAEAALLAGLPQSPSAYARNRQAALRRRDWVLDRMVETGKISAADRVNALSEQIAFYKATAQASRIYSAPYFVSYIMSRLIDGDSGDSADNGYGRDSVFSGWNVYTTLDSRIQKAAEEAMAQGIEKYGTSANQGALVSIDARTGFIRAMVGGLDYKRDQFNIVTQGNRQPGSAFKPIVYTAAIDTGVCDLNKTFVDDRNFPGHHDGDKWYPKNYSGKYSNRSVTVLSAIKQSLNTIAVKVAMETGLDTVIDYANRMGIRRPMEPYPTLALGAWETGVRPLDLCSAYSVFAYGGQRPVPQGITRVLSANGEVMYESAARFEDTRIHPETIASLDHALQEVVLHGTGTAAAKVANARGKTGTTSDNRDAWFAGYTPELVTVVWAGRERRNAQGKVVTYLAMPGATGGHLCAPIWRDFMLKAVPLQQAYNKAIGAATTEVAAKPPGELNKPLAPTTGGAQYGPPQQPSGLDDAPADGEPGGAEAAPGITGGAPSPPVTSSPQPGAGATTSAPTGAFSPGRVLGTPAADGGTDNPRGSFENARQRDPAGRLAVPSGRLAPVSTVPSPTMSGRPAEPSGRLASPPARRSDDKEDMVSVRLCADSSQRATRWCDATVDRRVLRRTIPGPCRLHKAPRGEEDR